VAAAASWPGETGNKMAAITWQHVVHQHEAEKEFFSLDRRKKRQV
jgi:hypothetical protein